MQVSCLKHKPNMVADAQGDTPDVVGRISLFFSLSAFVFECKTRKSLLRLPPWARTFFLSFLGFEDPT